MSAVNICNVCNLTSEKTGKHYGAITCYACRAFFRRAQVKLNLEVFIVPGPCYILGVVFKNLKLPSKFDIKL